MTFQSAEIETTIGRILRVLDPAPEEIDLLDIAQSLARLCRFNGHTRYFHSVAEHSVEVASLMEFLYPANRHAFLWGLLHDAPEAFIGDIPRPVKRCFDGVKEMEEKLMEVIAKCYGLPYPCPWQKELGECDTQAFLWEVEALMPSRGEHEMYTARRVGLERFSLLPNPLASYQETTPQAAKELFLDAFNHGGSVNRPYAFSCPLRN